jgi:hypothetical protein
MRKKIIMIFLRSIYILSIMSIAIMGIISLLSEFVGVGVMLRLFSILNIPFNFFTPYIVMIICFPLAILSHRLYKKYEDKPSKNENTF